MPSTATLASKVRSLIADSRELERLRRENASLMIEIKGLRQDTAEISKLLGTGARGPGRPSGTAGRPAGSGTKAPRATGGKRFRTTAADVDRMYKALVGKAPSDWKTKAEICKSAGLGVDACAAAWKRASEGYELDGKKHAAILKSNGSRGLKGRYRKA